MKRTLALAAALATEMLKVVLESVMTAPVLPG